MDLREPDVGLEHLQQSSNSTQDGGKTHVTFLPCHDYFDPPSLLCASLNIERDGHSCNPRLNALDQNTDLTSLIVIFPFFGPDSSDVGRGV